MDIYRNPNIPTKEQLIEFGLDFSSNQEEKYYLEEMLKDKNLYLNTSEIQSATNREWASKGIHPMQIHSQNGTHHTKSDDYRQYSRERVNEWYASGKTFGFTSESSSDIQNNKIQNGTHHFQDKSAQSDRGKRAVKSQKEKGTYAPSFEWVCEHCSTIGKNKTNYIRFHGEKCKSRFSCDT